jgi:homopolymeric O-antigen transport system ATP-binding protein
MSPTLEVQRLSKVYKHELHPKDRQFREEFSFWFKRLMNGRKTNQLPAITALNDVNFKLEKGDILGVVGRNGAGKSTLLKIMAGIVKPSDGQVAYEGRLVSILELGAGFHPDLSGRENVFLNGRLLGLSKEQIEHQFSDILQFSELEEFIDEPVKHYSHGMYLRLAFAVLAHLDPDVLLLDEVISVGDISFHQKSHNKIVELANRGTTIIIVSHDPDRIKELCNKCMWLDKGRLMRFGATPEVLNDYLETCMIAETASLKKAILSKDSISWPEGLNIKDEICVCSYSLQAKDKPASEPKQTNDELQITIEFEKLNNNENVEITVTILSLYGTWVLADTYGRFEKYHNSVKQAGRYRCICTIPAGILNFGFYQLGFLISKSEELIYQDPSLMNFKIELSNEEGVKGHLARKAACLIKPLGRWEICRK